MSASPPPASRGKEEYCTDTTNPAVTSHRGFCRCLKSSATTEIAACPTACHPSLPKLPVTQWPVTTKIASHLPACGLLSPIFFLDESLLCVGVQYLCYLLRDSSNRTAYRQNFFFAGITAGHRQNCRSTRQSSVTAVSAGRLSPPPAISVAGLCPYSSEKGSKICILRRGMSLRAREDFVFKR